MDTQHPKEDTRMVAPLTRGAREAARKRGEDIGEVYSDHHTGKSRNRPDLMRLLADA